MKFKVSQEELNRAMQFVASAIDGKSPHESLNNVLIKAENNKLLFVGTDTKVEKRVSVDAVIEEEGIITVPAKKLTDFAKNADKTKDISFHLKETTAEVKSGRSKWKLQTLSADTFPFFPEFSDTIKLSVDIEKLVDGITRCAPAMAARDVRYYLNGMLFDLNAGKLNVVATDGHRLSCYALETDSQESRKAIVPRDAVLDMLKMINKSKDAQIEFDHNNVKIKSGEMVMSAVLVEGNYPDYKRVMPNDLPHEASVNAEELRGALKRTMPLANQYNALSLSFAESSLTVEAANQNQEKATESIPCAHDADIVIGFNGSYVQDAIGGIKDDNVLIQLRDGGSSARIDEGDFTAVLMPMRI